MNLFGRITVGLLTGGISEIIISVKKDMERLKKKEEEIKRQEKEIEEMLDEQLRKTVETHFNY